LSGRVVTPQSDESSHADRASVGSRARAARPELSDSLRRAGRPGRGQYPGVRLDESDFGKRRRGIIAGHARLLAAQKLGLEEVPVIVLSHLTPTQNRALVIADNKLALKAGWAEETLRAEIVALQEDGFDLGVVGFSDEELRVLLGDGGEALATATGEEAIPEAPVNPVSPAGDLWAQREYDPASAACTSRTSSSRTGGSGLALRG